MPGTTAETIDPLGKILTFLSTIGLQTIERPFSKGFLDGVRIENGILYFDPNDDFVEVNLLHEAGHLAVTPSQFRSFAQPNISSLESHFNAWFREHPDAFSWPENPLGRAILQAGEAEAIAWSYAACVHLDLDIAEYFERGFETFPEEPDRVSSGLVTGHYLGIHGLAHAGMTDSPRSTSEHAYPKMRRWLQT